MMSEKRSWQSILLKILTRFDLAAAAALFPYLMAAENESSFMLIVCLLWIPAIVSAVLECWVESNVLLTLGELLCFGLLAIPLQTGGGLLETASLAVGIVVILVPSLISAGAGRVNLLDHPVAMEALLFVLDYVMTIWLEAGYAYRFLVYVLAIIYLMLYFYWKNQYGLRQYVRMRGATTKSMQDQLEKDVLPVNRRSLVPFFLALVVISALVWIPLGSQAISDYLNDKYSEVVDDITEWFEEEDINLEEALGGSGEDEEDPEKQEGKEPPETLVILRRGLKQKFKFLDWAIPAVMWTMVAIVVAILLWLLRKLSSQGGGRSRNEMQQEFELSITEESTRIQRKNGLRGMDGAGGSFAENLKIRKLYRNAVRHGWNQQEDEEEDNLSAKQQAEKRKKKRLIRAMTPLELEHSAGLRQKPEEKDADQVTKDGAESASAEESAIDVKLLHDLYERARYGKEALTKEDVRLAEQAVNKG